MVEGTIWFEDALNDDENDYYISEYDITAAPNDFNVKTLYDFFESGAVKVPGFQRNYVWDIKRASKLIESLIIGLPIPQIFLYEESRNKFLVIDGQQRLLSIYYFIKQRFPPNEKRIELREIFDREGHIPDSLFANDKYFSKFNLKLPENLPNKPNKFNNLNYSTLGDYRTSFELRTIRCIIIKQNQPENDQSSIFEIFNRLNSGGLNLTPQEIRISLFHSDFFDMLSRINLNKRWRKLIGLPNPDLHMKDLEVLLRGFAMLYRIEEYKPSMVKFLNNFAQKSKRFPDSEVLYLEKMFISFLESCSELKEKSFVTKGGRRFNISMFEAVFAAICKPFFINKEEVKTKISQKKLQKLKSDPDFIESTQKSTTSADNVKMRFYKAESYLMSSYSGDTIE